MSGSSTSGPTWTRFSQVRGRWSRWPATARSPRSSQVESRPYWCRVQPRARSSSTAPCALPPRDASTCSTLVRRGRPSSGRRSTAYSTDRQSYRTRRPERPTRRPSSRGVPGSDDGRWLGIVAALRPQQEAPRHQRDVDRPAVQVDVVWVGRGFARPAVEQGPQPRYVEDRPRQLVALELAHVCEQLRSLPGPPLEPVGRLQPALRRPQCLGRKPPVHRPPDQQPRSAVAGELLLRDGEAELNQPPVRERAEGVDPVERPVAGLGFGREGAGPRDVP